VRAAWPGGTGPLLTLGPEDVPPALAFATAPLLALLWLIAFDFFQYWVHRAQHAVPALWRFHAVHHSHEAMDSVNAFSHPIDALGVLAGVLAFGLLVDFAFEPMIYFSAFLSIRDRLLHTRAPIHFGPLHPVLIDNRHHFLHHHPDPAFHNCNFGNSLTLWDRLYGTYRAPTSDMLGRTGLIDLAPVASVSGYLRADLPMRQPTLIKP
jgi:sterol desaturase/sphingolipid hydroxylase (fatty acid hydroxylase superfamily)